MSLFFRPLRRLAAVVLLAQIGFSAAWAQSTPQAPTPQTSSPQTTQAMHTLASLTPALQKRDATALAQATALLSGAQGVELVQALSEQLLQLQPANPAQQASQSLYFWALALFEGGQIQTLAELNLKLILGADLDEDAIERFNRVGQRPHPAPAHPHAHALGHWVAMAQKAADESALGQDKRQQALRDWMGHMHALASRSDAGRRWMGTHALPSAKAAVDTRLLLEAARPAKAVRMRANGEMDIENGDTAAAFSDFMRAMRLARELLALR